MKNTKERQERISLRQVFSEREYPNTHKAERPDFIIHHEGGMFGVEVTSYYQDQTSARYNNTPGYMHNILEDEGNIKKKDRGKLAPVLVGMGSGDKPEYTTTMVFQKYLSFENRLNTLEQIINSKIDKSHQYSKDLEAIDLIVHDQGDLFGGEDGRKIEKYLIELSQVPIKGLPYRKIYISKKHGAFDEPITFVSDMYI